LDVGAAVFAGEIVGELSTKVMESIAKDESSSGIDSTVLHELIEELDDIRIYVSSSLIQAINDEKRRVQNADATLEKALQNSNLIISQRITEKLKNCKEMDLIGDNCIDENVNAIKIFADRTPKFANLMVAAEDDCVR
jgi:hypothetical protein